MVEWLCKVQLVEKYVEQGRWHKRELRIRNGRFKWKIE